MNKYRISIDAVSYRKIHKKLSNYNIKIGGTSIRTFMIANAVPEDTSFAPSIRVKRVILHVAGDMDTRPEELENETDLVHDLNYKHVEFLLLRKCLDRLVKEYDADLKISAAETDMCTTVQDCLELANSKIHRKTLIWDMETG
jgi:hypothetical protein